MRMWRLRSISLLIAFVAVGTILAAGIVLLWLQSQGVAPRALAPYLAKRAAGHNPLIVSVGNGLAHVMTTLDRGSGIIAMPRLALGAGAQLASRLVPVSEGRSVEVMDVRALRRALAQAEPGDVITLLPGVYQVQHGALLATRPGMPKLPITVRASELGSVVLELGTAVGFKISAPYWRFENLTLRGLCRNHSNCEHAFQVVGAASYFSAVNNVISDVNAAFKINSERGHFPDHGLIDSNTVDNTGPRRTRNPVTPVDLVGASGWTVRANVLSDFVKAGGDRISYGAFAKGAGSGNIFERNIIWCERTLRGQPGQRVGLSLGGGGTMASACRDGRCIVEQERSTLRDNLVLGCSDAGVYLNSAASSTMERNSILDTAGVQVRYPTSSVSLRGNLIDGPIVARDGAVVRDEDNLTAPLAYSYLGYHPVRALFRDLEGFDLGWKDGGPPQRTVPDHAPAGPDLCGGAPHSGYGAFLEFSGCLARP